MFKETPIFWNAIVKKSLFWRGHVEKTLNEQCEWVSVSQAYICVCVLSNGKEGNGIKCSDHWSWKLPIHWFDKQHKRPLWYIARSSLCVVCVCLWRRDKAGVPIWLCVSGMELKKKWEFLCGGVCLYVLNIS